MKSLLFLLAAVVAVTYATSRCSMTPPTWFGIVRQIYWNASDPLQLRGVTYSASYDRKAGKIKTTDLDLVFPGEKRIVLLDFKAKEEYVSIDGNCKKSRLEGEIPSFGVIPDAKFNAAEFIGAELPNLGVLVNEYYKIIPDKSIYLSSYAPVSGEECIPVLFTDMAASPKLAMDLRVLINATTTLPTDAFSRPPGC